MWCPLVLVLLPPLRSIVVEILNKETLNFFKDLRPQLQKVAVHIGPVRERLKARTWTCEDHPTQRDEDLGGSKSAATVEQLFK